MHFYLAASNLLPNFLIIVTHSIFNIMSSGIPLNKNGTCVEDFVLVKYVIMKYYSAINVSQNWTDSLDDPVFNKFYLLSGWIYCSQVLSVFVSESVVTAVILKSTFIAPELGTSVRRRTLLGQQQHTICTQLGTLFSGQKYLDNRSLETFDVTGYQCKWNSKNVKSEIAGRIVFLEDCGQLYFEMQACVVGTSRTQRSKRNL